MSRFDGNLFEDETTSQEEDIWIDEFDLNHQSHVLNVDTRIISPVVKNGGNGYENLFDTELDLKHSSVNNDDDMTVAHISSVISSKILGKNLSIISYSTERAGFNDNDINTIKFQSKRLKSSQGTLKSKSNKRSIQMKLQKNDQPKPIILSPLTQTITFVAKNDSRRSFSNLLINSFNGCDTTKLSKTLTNLCHPDVMFITHFASSAKNPYSGFHYSETPGLGAVLSLWGALFQSAPDLLFEIIDTKVNNEISYEGSSTIESRFLFNATRILDIVLTDTIIEDDNSSQHPHHPPDDMSVSSGTTTATKVLNIFSESSRTSVDEEKNVTAVDSSVHADSLSSFGEDLTTNISHPNTSTGEKKTLKISKMGKFQVPRSRIDSMKIKCAGFLRLVLDSNSKIKQIIFDYNESDVTNHSTIIL